MLTFHCLCSLGGALLLSLFFGSIVLCAPGHKVVCAALMGPCDEWNDPFSHPSLGEADMAPEIE
jgi:hypothetical protein